MAVMAMLSVAFILVALTVLVSTCYKQFDKLEFSLYGFSFALLIFCLIIGVFGIEKEHYKRGQIDALTGKVRYVLVTNADSTKTWEEKKW